MAKTAFTTSNALTKKVWEEKLFRDAVKDSYFSRFMGNGPDSLVQVKTQLEKSQGDKVTFGIRMRLTGAGQTGNTTLEGNEEKLTTYDSSVSLQLYRHAVRDNGALDRQRAMFSIDDESQAALKDWGAEKIDSLCFDTLLTSPTKIFYREGSAGAFTVTGTPATAKSSLRAAYSKITTSFISACKVWAKTGGNRTVVPLRPFKVEGKDYYVMLVHPDNLYDLRIDTTFQGAMKDAQERGKDNPLFQGAVAIWDGVVIHEHENIPTAADGGAGAETWSRGAFLGAQALVWAWGSRPEVVKETFDYGHEHGYAWGMISGCAKPVFNSLDHGSVGLYLCRTNVSGQ